MSLIQSASTQQLRKLMQFKCARAGSIMFAAIGRIKERQNVSFEAVAGFGDKGTGKVGLDENGGFMPGSLAPSASDRQSSMGGAIGLISDGGMNRGSDTEGGAATATASGS